MMIVFFVVLNFLIKVAVPTWSEDPTDFVEFFRTGCDKPPMNHHRGGK